MLLFRLVFVFKRAKNYVINNSQARKEFQWADTAKFSGPRNKTITYLVDPRSGPWQARGPAIISGPINLDIGAPKSGFRGNYTTIEARFCQPSGGKSHSASYATKTAHSTDLALLRNSWTEYDLQQVELEVDKSIIDPCGFIAGSQ